MLGLERLRAARREKERRDHGARRYTQDELETMTGLGTRTLSRLFDGTEPVDRRTLERAFDSFGLALGRADFEVKFDRDRTLSRTHLPADLTTFLGRDRDVAQIGATLSMSRLLTLTGLGGVGKTRTAIRVAREHSQTFRDGVWFFDLSAVAGKAPLTLFMASWLGLQDTSGSSGESALFRHLADKSVLLVLDNCEHIRESAAALCRELLQRCSSLKVLATSREPLRLPGESIYQMAPLELPPKGARTTLADARRYDAIRLFEDRAAATSVDFELSESTLAGVKVICRRLDGIPLAIELACAQLRGYSIDEVAEQLAASLDRLQSAQRGVPDRQKTLTDSIEWSYSLLPDEERALLRAMSVFAGSWSLEAATTIVRDLSLPVANVQTALHQLAEKSLVTTVGGDFGERYRMLGVTREHIITLLGAPEMDALRRAHAQYFVDLAGRSDSNRPSSSQLLWHQRLELEIDDLRSALRWAVEDGHALGIGARLAIGLTRWWVDGGRWKEGRRWLDMIMKADETLFDARTRARVVYGVCFMATLARDRVEGETMLIRALAAFDGIADVDAFADALGVITLSRRFRRQADGVEEYLAFRTFRSAVAAEVADESAEPGITRPLDVVARGSEALLRVSLRCYRDTGNRRGEVMALQNLAVLAAESDRDAATATLLCERAIEIALEIHRERNLAGIYTLLSEIAAFQNDYDEALRRGEQALAIFRAFGHRPFSVEVLCRLGAYAALGDDVRGAASFFRDALAAAIAFADEWGVIASVEGFARVAALRDEPRVGVGLLGYAAALRANWSGAESRPFVDRRGAFMATMREALEPLAFAESWEGGRRWTIDDALEETSKLLDALDIAPISTEADSPDELLRPRE